MINFQGIEFETFIGQVVGQPAKVCLPAAEAPKTVQMQINWLLYQVGDALQNFGIGINLQGISPAGALSAIKSVYIDNYESEVPIYVYFPDTGFVAGMPPFSAGWIPVITNTLKAIVYGIGFSDTNIPLTNVFFNNFAMPQAINTIPQTSAINPVSITYVGSVVNPVVTGGTVKTFTAAAVGAPGTGRRIIVGIAYDTQNTNNPLLTSMTLGGTPMTLFSNTISGFPSNLSAGIIGLDAGGTATIIANFNMNVTNVAIFVWNMYNNISNTPDNVKEAISVGNTGAIELLTQNDMAFRSGLINLGVARSIFQGGPSGTATLTGTGGIILDDNLLYTNSGQSRKVAGHYNSPTIQTAYQVTQDYFMYSFAGNKMITADWSP